MKFEECSSGRHGACDGERIIERKRGNRTVWADTDPCDCACHVLTERMTERVKREKTLATKLRHAEPKPESSFTYEGDSEDPGCEETL